MSPGHVATDMGNADMSNAGGRAAPLTVDMSIDGMLDDSGGGTHWQVPAIRWGRASLVMEKELNELGFLLLYLVGFE